MRPLAINTLADLGRSEGGSGQDANAALHGGHVLRRRRKLNRRGYFAIPL